MPSEKRTIENLTRSSTKTLVKDSSARDYKMRERRIKYSKRPTIPSAASQKKR